MNIENILDESLLEKSLEGSNALILTETKKERKRQNKGDGNHEEDENEKDDKIDASKKMSTRKRRKLKQLEEKKKRNELYENLRNDLEKYSLSNEELQLMMSVANTKINNKQKQLLRRRYLAAKVEIPEFLKIKSLSNKQSHRKSDFYSRQEQETETETEPEKESEAKLELKQGQVGEYLDLLGADITEEAKASIQSENTAHEENADGLKVDGNDISKPSGYVRKFTTLNISSKTEKPKINRNPEIEVQRLELPVRGYEYEILDAVENNDVVIITGSTGSGKSTQVPQLLYEAGYTIFSGEKNSSTKCNYLIGLTQPRRIAATSLSKRIGEELNDPSVVGYQIRYDKQNCTEETAIKVMTDGILLQEVQKDLLCTKYSVILIDEAHERTVNTDILIGLLSRVVVFRREEFRKKNLEKKNTKLLPPLKLIIMSATLRVTDFSENPKLFPNPPPIVNIETPNFPVTVHFSKNTPKDYITAAYKKILLIHNKLPPGSILVFVTGKREVNILVNLINNKNKQKHKTLRNLQENIRSSNKLSMIAGFTDDFERDELDEFELEEEDENKEDENEESEEDENGEDEDEKDESEEDESEEDENEEKAEEPLQKDGVKEDEERDGNRENLAKKEIVDIWDSFNSRDNRKRKVRLHKDVNSTVWKGGGVLEEVAESELDKKATESQKPILKAFPLYASMSFDEQSRAFKLPESNNVRHVIISTNVSETSITIPNVRYVIDTGKEKRRNYSGGSESSHFSIEWISKASSSQRLGRAGRVGPGHCYRLYSSPIYENIFPKFSPIDILSIPLDSILLYMHSLGIPDIFDFPFPTSPKKEQIEKSYQLLSILGCIQRVGSKYSLSNQGISLSKLPLPPRFGKILLSIVAYVRRKIDGDFQFLELLQQACILVSYLTIGNIKDEAFSVSFENDSAGNKDQYSKEDQDPEFENLPTNFGNDIEHNLWCCIKYLKYCESSTSRRSRLIGDKFCKKFELNPRSMHEMKLMSLQLFSIIKKRYLDGEIDSNIDDFRSIIWPPNLPNSLQKQVIRNFYIASFIDHIAVRNDGDLASKSSYQTPNILNHENNTNSVFIHPKSVLKNTKPKYLVYSQIFSSSDKSREYLCDCILITAEDIIAATSLKHSLIDSSKILSLPTPFYSQKHDSVFGLCTPKYRNNSIVIDLPSSEIELGPEISISFEIFARAILEGLVFKEFKDQRISKHLRLRDNQKSFKLLVSALQEQLICNRDSLTRKFKTRRDFLLKQILQLYDISAHNSIRSFWPPI
ncbi:ATP-dependent RNA helicase DEAH13-like [Cryptosporidium felis]|nr:ATP-dependent RNA helicase DEAH13-like [Cryptosporidium felis]